MYEVHPPPNLKVAMSSEHEDKHVNEKLGEKRWTVGWQPTIMTPADVWGIWRHRCVSPLELLPGSAPSDLKRSTASHTESRRSFIGLTTATSVAPLLEAPECLTHSGGEAQTTKASVVACSSCKRLKNQLPTLRQMTLVPPTSRSRAPQER